MRAKWRSFQKSFPWGEVVDCNLFRLVQWVLSLRGFFVHLKQLRSYRSTVRQRVETVKGQSRSQHFLRRLVGKFAVRTLSSVDFGRRYPLVLCRLEILFFREDSRLVRRAALKHHSARHGLGSKKVEQELTEGTEVLRYLCYLLFYEFGRGYAALSSSSSR